MRLRLALALIGIFPLPLAGVPAGESGSHTSVASSTNKSIPAGNYTYAEMIDLGADVESLGSGLPVCKPNPEWQPPTSDEEAEAVEMAAEHAPECIADITTFTFTVGAPPPHPGYHHNGVRTAGGWRGGDATIESGNPDVDHGGNPEFIVGRVLAVNASVEWVEAGWAEVSWRSASPPYIYRFTQQSGVWGFPSGYPIDSGDRIDSRVHDCDGNGTCASIFWDGQWNRVAKATNVRCHNAAGDNNCYIENYLEVNSDHPGSPHPDIGRKRHNFADVKRNDGTWRDWTAEVDSYAGSVEPYDHCMIARYTAFDVGKSLTC